MKTVIEQNKKLLLGLAFLFCLIFAGALTVFTGQPSVGASNEIGDYSLAHLTQAATQFLNHSQDPMYGGVLPTTGLTENSFAGLSTSYNYGNAGGLLGYQDGFDNDSVMTVSGWYSRNTVEYYYETLARNIKVEGVPATAGTGDGNFLFSGYGYYGYALSALGLDETTTTGASGFRKISGGIILALYVLSSLVSMIFNFVLTALKWLNPFRLFLGTSGSGYARGQHIFAHNHVLNSGADSGLTAGISADQVTDWSSALQYGAQSLQTFLTDIYTFLTEHAFVMLALFIAFMLVTWLLVNNGKNFWKSAKGLIIRVVFICAGVPLMFATYTAALDWVGDYTATQNTVGSNLVFSTFFDFEKWVYTNRLNPGSDKLIAITYDKEDYTASLDGESVANARKIAHQLNQSLYGEDIVGRMSFDSGRNGIGFSSDAQHIEQMYQFDYRMLGMGNSSGSGGVIENDNKDTADTYETVLSMLSRYMNGSTITGASYEAYIVGQILHDVTPADGDLANSDAVKEAVWEFAVTHNWRNFDRNQALEFSKVEGQGGGEGITLDAMTDEQVKERAKIRFAPSNTANYTAHTLWGSGTLSYKEYNVGPHFTNRDNSNKMSFSGSSGDDAMGLSAIAMYNYLNSSFQESKITVYSSGLTATDQVQIGHYSVNAVGSTTLIRFVYLLDAIVLLGCTVVLGFGYAFGILFSNFKALFKAVPAVMTGMFGSLRGIATSLVLMFALIIEVLGTCVLYILSTELISAIYTVIERPLALLLEDPSHSSSLQQFAPFIFGLISAGSVAWLTFQLLHWRVMVCRAATEATSSFISKIIGVNVSAPDLHGKMSVGQMAAGAATAVVGARALGVDVDDMKSAIGERIQDVKNAFGGGDVSADAEGALAGGSTTEAGATNQFGVRGSGGATSTGLLMAGANAAGSALYGGSSSEGDRGTSGTQTGSFHGTNTNLSKTEADVSSDMNSSADINGSEEVTGEIMAGAEAAGDEAGAPDVVPETRSTDAAAEQYVEENKEAFLNSVNNAVAAQQPNITKAKEQDIAIRRADAQAHGNPNDPNSFVITDAQGAQSQGLSIVRSDTGEAYTVADKMEGASFTIQDGDGNVYVDSAGNEYNNMSADNIAISTSSDGERVSAIRTADGERSAVMAQSDVGRLNTTDDMGVSTQNVRVVNSETGNIYTMADKKAGANFSVVNADGSTYVDSSGNNYQNVSANMLEMDKSTGMVTRFGAADENGQVHVNQTYDANQRVYGYNSTVTSQAANNIINNGGQANTPLVVPGQGGGQAASGPVTVNQNVAQTAVGGAQNVSQSATQFSQGGAQNVMQNVSGGAQSVNVTDERSAFVQSGGVQVRGGSGGGGNTVVVPMAMNVRGGSPAPAAAPSFGPAATPVSPVVNNNYHVQNTGARMDSRTIVNNNAAGGGMQRMPGMPAMPSMPQMPSMPSVPQARPVPGMPGVPGAAAPQPVVQIPNAPAAPVPAPTPAAAGNYGSAAPMAASAGGRDTFTRERVETYRDGGSHDTVTRETFNNFQSGPASTEFHSTEVHDRSVQQTTHTDTSVERETNNYFSGSAGDSGGSASPSKRAPSDGGRDYGDNPFDRRV